MLPGSSRVHQQIPDFLVFFLCTAVKEAAVQRRHNLYRDSIVLTNSDPNLHMLGETPHVDWATKFGGDELEGAVNADSFEGGRSGIGRRQVVSMILLDEVPLPYESVLEVPGVELIPEEDAEMFESQEEDQGDDEEDLSPPEDPKSPDSVTEIRGLINPVVEMVVPVSEKNQSDMTESTEPESTIGPNMVEDGVEEDVTHVTTMVETVPRKSLKHRPSPETILHALVGNEKQEVDNGHREEAVIKNANKEVVREDAGKRMTEISAAESDFESSQMPPQSIDSSDSGFPSPTNERLDDGEPQPITKSLNKEDTIINPANMEVVLV